MTNDMNVAKVLPRLSSELKISAGQIAAVAKLFAEGNTIPFIARYRKEAHGNLDEVQISQIQERLTEQIADAVMAETGAEGVGVSACVQRPVCVRLLMERATALARVSGALPVTVWSTAAAPCMIRRHRSFRSVDQRLGNPVLNIGGHLLTR